MSVKDLVDQIKEVEKTYSASNTLLTGLKGTVLVAVVGPFAVGKTTLMRAVEQQNKNFTIVRSFTTRPRRSNEAPDTYRFLPHTEASLQNILTLLHDGKLVQIAVHPSTGYIYGSNVEDYRNKFSLMAIFSFAMAEFRALPFGSMKELAIVTSPADWLARVKELPKVIGDEDTKKRLFEAESSLEWLLTQGNELAWVVNDNGQIDKATKETIGLCKGGNQPNPNNRLVGEQLLQTVRLQIQT
jgi:hypothetical protein